MNDETKVCSLILDAQNYNPDTLDLHTDKEAQEYWLDCMHELVKKFSIQAANSECNDPTTKFRAKQYQRDYINIINSFKENTDRFN